MHQRSGFSANNPANGLLLLLGLVFYTHSALQAQQLPIPTNLPQRAGQPLEVNKPLEREMKLGQVHRYALPLAKGQFAKATIDQRKIGLLVRLLGPDGAKIADIDSPANDIPIALEAKKTGTYHIEVFPYNQTDAQPALYQIKLIERLAAPAYRAQRADELRKQQVVSAWLSQQAMPLKSLEAGSDFADLDPLKKTLAGVQFVGLGEATHGTREFFQVKHRLLDFLVRQMGFRIIAFEASYAALQPINDYVMGRTDGAQALDGPTFALSNTQEMRAILTWARQYNAAVSADNQVQFVGFDIQQNQIGRDKLRQYLQRTAPQYAASRASFLTINERDLTSQTTSAVDSVAKVATLKMKALKSDYNELFVFLELNKDSLIINSSSSEYQQAREYARVLTQCMDAFTQADMITGNVRRDGYMADVFKRRMEGEPVDTRVVIWAHNDHISADDNGLFMPIGAYLRRTYGPSYYALGLTFNQGAFQASATRDVPANRLWRSFTVSAAPVGSTEWQLSQTKLDQFIIDFRSQGASSAVSEWLGLPHLMRGVGWFYDSAYAVNYFKSTTLSKQYDGLLFIETTSRARPDASLKSDFRPTDK